MSRPQTATHPVDPITAAHPSYQRARSLAARHGPIVPMDDRLPPLDGLTAQQWGKRFRKQRRKARHRLIDNVLSLFAVAGCVWWVLKAIGWLG